MYKSQKKAWLPYQVILYPFYDRGQKYCFPTEKILFKSWTIFCQIKEDFLSKTGQNPGNPGDTGRVTYLYYFM